VSRGQDAPFGARLRRLREATGLTQEELAGRAGLSAKNISDLERGERRRPYPHTVRALADALELSEDERAALFAAVPKRGSGGRTVLVVAPEPTLPMPPTPLVGRERNVQEIRGFLHRREVKLLTLTGTGGVGKTRLALQAARDAGELFPDGVAFVALASLNNVELVIPSVVRSFGLRETAGQSPREALGAYLRPKRLLLTLDNFEHLLEAAPEVSWLVETCPNLTVLVTSRAPLRVGGEQEYPVPPLELPASTRDPGVEEVLGSPSGRLFVERARAASPGFSLSRQNAAAVAAICWRLAGLPLALELAAGKVRFLSPSSLLARLDRALSTGWGRDVPERQRTVRATLDWSHDLLSEPAKALFRRLSVFAGGFTLEAAEAVGAAGGEDTENVLYLLGELVEQSLVIANTGANGNESRYGMLEPVRQYAKEKLEENEENEETRQRHAAYFLDLTDRAAQELTRAEQDAWLERLGHEHDNLRAALSWLLEREDAEDAARLGWDLMWFWHIRGHLAEGRRWMERTLALEDSLTSTGRAKAMTVVAALAFAQANFDRTTALTEEASRLAREAGDWEVLSLANLYAGSAALGRGEHNRAAAFATESVELYRTLGDQVGVGLALILLVHVALGEGDFVRAERLLDESEELLRAAGSWWNLTANLSTRALVAQLLGDHARTVVVLREGLALAPRLRDTQAVVYNLEGLAGALAMLGKGRRAARLFGAVEALRERTGSAITLSPWRELHERHLESLRTRLDAEELAAAWAEGRSMTFEQAVAYALEDNEASSE
jgi:predicted ATPase/transcriptional regulator with XRE-family HTH domain